MSEPLYIAKGTAEGGPEIYLYPRMANRHGLVAGATGTGKTVTLQTIAENFSRIGVPVFVSDTKGDISGVCQPAGENPKIQTRVQELGLTNWAASSSPVVFWDVFDQSGHPLRTTVSDMGPLLLARMLNLNDIQAGVLSIIFKVADDKRLLLLDLKDLRSMVSHVGDHAAEYKTEYGNVSPASIGAIQRGLLTLEEQGADKFFGEPALAFEDLIQTDPVTGFGNINILAAHKLVQSPKLYAIMHLWILAELFENLPEVGDQDKPKLIFFFDEAHLLFADAPDALQDKIEQVVRMIRSKGVGVYFVTQNPIDVPDRVLGQLGNRVQHALRAFTPRDQKAVRTAAQTFRVNPNLDIEAVITELGVGEALVSFLDEKGTPSITERAYILPPRSQIGMITPEQRDEVIKASLIAGVYETGVDRESAYEMLKAQAEDNASAAEQVRLQKEAEAAAKKAEAEAKKAEADQKRAEAELKKAEADERKAEAEQKRLEAAQAKAAAKEAREQEKLAKEQAKAQAKAQKEAELAAKNDPFNLGNIANQAGKKISRGLFGNMFGSSKRKS